VTATKKYRLSVAGFLGILAVITAVQGMASGAAFPLAFASGLLVLAAVAGISAVQDRPWVAAENVVLAIIGGGAGLIVLASLFR
jgi:hypothetical protein